MSRWMRRVVAPLVAALLGIGSVVAGTPGAHADPPTTYYVFPDGNDAATCTSVHSACQTVQGAVGKAGAGDIVDVGAGDYPGDVSIAVPLTLTHTDAGVATLAGTVDITDTSGDVTVSELTFSGAQAGIVDDGNSGSTTITDNTFALTGTTGAIVLENARTDPRTAVIGGNSGTVAAPAPTIDEQGPFSITTPTANTIAPTGPAPTVAVTSPAIHVAPGGPAQQVAALSVPDGSSRLNNPEYDVTLAAPPPTVESSQLSISDDTGSSAGLLGSTAGDGSIVGTLPYVAGPVTRRVSIAATGGAPNTLAITVALDEYDVNGVLLNQVAVGAGSVVDNNPPQISSPSQTVHASGPTSITLGPPEDADQQPLTYSIVTKPSNGVLGQIEGSAVDYTPASDRTSSNDQFIFTASDGMDTTGPITAFVSINTAPTADSKSVQMLDTAASQPIELSATDPDPQTTLTFGLDTPPNSGTVDIDSATGAATYTPTGSPQNDSFRYTVSDGMDTSSPVSVAITVVHGPVAADTSAVIGYDATSTSVSLSGSDDVPGVTLTYNVGSQPAHGTLGAGATSDELTYTPTGAPQADSFTYTVSDGANTSEPATARIVVHTRPVANSATAVLDQGSNSVQLRLTGSAFSGTSAIFQVPTASDHGGSIAPASQPGFWTYTQAGSLHSDSFTYTVTDGTFTSAPAAVTITANHAPTNAASTMTMTDTHLSATVQLAGSDEDAGTTLTYAATQPAHGTVTVTGSGRATYRPSGQPQPDSFTYTVSDGRLTSTAQTVTITVRHHPIASDAAETWSCNSGTHSFPLVSSDPDGTLAKYALVANAQHGTAAVNASGRATYKPDTNFRGLDSFGYRVTDPTGLRSATATVSITISKATARISSMSLSPSRPTSAQSPTLTIRVSSAGNTSDGAVHVASGSGTVTAHVKHGVATAVLAAYPGGSHSISAGFAGTFTTLPSPSRRLTFTVTKVASALVVTTNPLELTTTTKGAVAIVHVSAGSIHPNSGTVTIDENGRRLATATVRTSSARLPLPTFALGQHNLEVSYTGTRWVAPSSVLKVERVALGG